MRIQHNIASLNSYRNLMGNNSNIAKNLEKLSSGYRINKAGDDAAGLAISEKMRSQITGLETATKNANDGISLVQTIEGALTETHAILNRLIELTTQSANGVYDDDTDRASIQDEANSLLTEIDRIGDSTDFNKIHVLNASAGGLEANPEELKSYIIKGLKGGWLEKSADIIKEAYGYDITKTGPKPNIGKLTLQFKPDMDSAVASVGGSSDGLNLNINMKAFQDLTGVDGMPKNDPGKTMKYMTADRVIAHEMTHAAMDVYFGENGAGMNALHEMNHIWFIEGTA